MKETQIVYKDPLPQILHLECGPLNNQCNYLLEILSSTFIFGIQIKKVVLKVPPGS